MITKSRLFNSIIFIVLGAMLPIAFAPYHQYAFALIIPIVLVTLLHNLSPGRSAWYGWLFGLGYFGAGVSWIYISIHHFGHAPIPLSILITALFVSYLSLYPAFFAYLVQRINTTPIWKLLFIVPSVWVLLEWLRSWIFTGFHWLQIGYSQLDSPLSGYAPLLGIYGVSWLCLFTGAVLISPRFFNKRASYLGYITVSMIWIVGALLTTVNWTTPTTDRLTMSLVQGNIPQTIKWQPGQAYNIVKRFHQLTSEHWESDLIIWPEAAMPMLLEDAAPYLDGLDLIATRNNATVMLGVPIRKNTDYFNSLVLLGKNQGQYDKRHLLPFAEYTPLAFLFKPLTDTLNIPMSDFSSGKLQQEPIQVNHINITPFICYEIAEPDEVRRSIAQHNILVTITDDSWFDGSIAADQHLQMARMRSKELSRWQVFVASRGTSAVINNQGKVLASLPAYQTDVLTYSVPATNGFTPWYYFGSWPIILFSLGLIVIAWYRGYKRTTNELQTHISCSMG